MASGGCSVGKHFREHHHTGGDRCSHTQSPVPGARPAWGWPAAGHRGCGEHSHTHMRGPRSEENSQWNTTMTRLPSAGEMGFLSRKSSTSSSMCRFTAPCGDTDSAPPPAARRSHTQLLHGRLDTPRRAHFPSATCGFGDFQKPQTVTNRNSIFKAPSLRVNTVLLVKRLKCTSSYFLPGKVCPNTPSHRWPD